MTRALETAHLRPRSIGGVDLRVGRPPLLDREREIELGRRMLEGEAMLLLAVFETNAGRVALGALASDVASGARPFRDVVRNVSDDEPRQRARLVELLGALERRRRSPGELARELADVRLHRDALAALSREAASPAVEEAQEVIEDARREIVEKNLRLVVLFARRYQNRGLALADVVQEGTLGLMHAIDKFDHRRGLRLSTYATWWIKQFIERALDDTGALIRVPSHLLEKKRRLHRAARRRRRADGVEPALGEVAEGLGIGSDAVERIEALPRDSISLETPIDATDGMRLADVMSADVETPEEAMRKRERARDLVAMLDAALDPRERRVVELRFGLGGIGERSCTEIGSELAISGQRVHQLEARALKKLRARGRAGSRPPRGAHSARKASIGSSRDARRAG